jgi:hypothetical protein
LKRGRTQLFGISDPSPGSMMQGPPEVAVDAENDWAVPSRMAVELKSLQPELHPRPATQLPPEDWELATLPNPASPPPRIWLEFPRPLLLPGLLLLLPGVPPNSFVDPGGLVAHAEARARAPNGSHT